MPIALAFISTVRLVSFRRTAKLARFKSLRLPNYIGVHDPAPSIRTGSASDRPNDSAPALGVRNAVAQSRTVI
jgi:hypothetical protein